MPARSKLSSPAQLPNSDAQLERLCQTLVCWTEVASHSELRVLQARYTIAFATIGFGGVMATMLSQNGNPVWGFLFLLFMAIAALLLNFHYCRQSKAWSETREQLENFAHIVSYHGIHLGKERPVFIKKPHEIWREFCNDYSVRPLDKLSCLFVAIIMSVMIACAGVMLGELKIYCEIDIRAGFSCQWAASTSVEEGAER